MQEDWKDILGYEGLYQVSNLGRVKRLPKTTLRVDGSLLPLKESILKKKASNNGYEHTCLTKEGSSSFFSVHRLVAEAFIPNPEKKYSVNHIDTNKHNNIVSNLEWSTREEQTQHAISMGKIGIKGECNVKSKLTQEQADSIRSVYKSGGATQLEISEEYGVSRQLVGFIINNKRYKK